MSLRVLHTIYSVNPAQGGTVEALMQIVKVSKGTNQCHEILTLDDPNHLVSGHTDSICVHSVGPSKRFYGYTPLLDAWLANYLSGYDCVVIHGCWQYHGLATFRACRKARIPYVQYTHGMLDPWFKHHYPLKHLKKWLYWPWAEYRILKHAASVIFTCEEEQRLAAQSFWLYEVNSTVIPLGIKETDYDLETSRSEFYDAFPQLKGKRLLTFMSRIHEKKGVDLLLEAAIKLQKSKKTSDDRWTLVIAGPSKDGPFLNRLKSLADQLSCGGPVESVVWPGMVRDQIKWGLLAASEAFVLPSHQENFGMVVAEALACGTPVLISDKVNIWKEVVEWSAAIVESDSIDGAVNLLEAWMNLSEHEQEQMRSNAKACFEANFRIEQNAAQVFALIERCSELPRSNSHKQR